MPRLSTILLPTTSAAIDNVAYDVTGEKARGDGYYGFSDGLHTVAQFLTGFTGKIEIQGTLALEPADADWIVLDTTEDTSSGAPGLTENRTFNFSGNYVWIRAVVTDITYGTITKIQMNH